MTLLQGATRYAFLTYYLLACFFYLPHATYHLSTGELFGIAHLHPEQPPTEAAPYAPDAPYPTGVVVQCEACDTWLPLPDKVTRR